MKRPIQLFVMLVVSCNNMAPQIAALLFLAPREFGVFSLGYLTYSLAVSVALSTVSEAYARARPVGWNASEPKNYAAVSTWLSVVFAVLAGLIFALLSGSYLTVLLSFLAVSCAARRTAIRYSELRIGAWRRILAVETAALTVFLIGLSTVFTEAQAMDSILLAWSLSGLVMWFLGSMPRPGSVQAAVNWVKQYKKEIKPLLRESLVLDTSSIGTPYILAPILGAVSFGIYRAVSNFNAPARLILNFIRPRLAARSLYEVLSSKYLLMIGVFSLTWGGAFSALLMYLIIEPSGIVMLDALAPYWLPTGLYMMFTVGLHYFYMVARTKVTARNLWRGRLVQSSVAIVFPICGALIWELPGAIWAIAIATMIGNLTWCCIVQLQAHRDI